MPRDQDAVVKDIRSVLRAEAEALAGVAAAVDGSYARAVAMMLACKGKVIVTGMGKSGLIAQKIAATLASTGTPALYLHPGDAMHGDLGLIQKQDLLLAVGKSGESQEINSILPAIRRIGCKLIALIANPDSTLGRAADLLVVIPVAREACPLNLAPTTSTTAALAVGDALSVALMKRRAFKSDHFALFHPGGRLGKRLALRVADVMRAGDKNPVVRLGDTVSRLLVEMTRKHCGAANVVDKKDRLIGIVTDYDVRRALETGVNPLGGSIARLLNPKPTTVGPDTPAYIAIDLMTNRKSPFLVLPVVDKKGRSVGLIHLHDVRARGL